MALNIKFTDGAYSPGPTGPTGPQGPQGSTGPTGLQGATSYLTLRNNTTDVGSDSVLAFVPSTDVALTTVGSTIEVALPPGPTGPTGLTGSQGPTGPTGDPFNPFLLGGM